jgi:hypothetical protein
MAAVSPAQAGIQFDAANPAIVTDAAFRNPLREPLAIDAFSSSDPAEYTFDGQPNFIAVTVLGQLTINAWSQGSNLRTRAITS